MKYFFNIFRSEKILRSVKARDSYGQVMSAVQKAQAIKQQEAMSRPDTPHDTGKYIF